MSAISWCWSRIVESKGDRKHRWIAAPTQKSAEFQLCVGHSRIAAAVHATMRTNEAQELRKTASDKEIQDAGRSE